MRPDVHLAVKAVAGLMRDSAEYRSFFKRCCKTGAFRLRAQSWQFRDELRDRGEAFPHADLEDALMLVARKVLPRTPAARWDGAWAEEMCAGTLARIGECAAGMPADAADGADFSGQGEAHELARRAVLANDPAAFRDALREWELVGIEALEMAKGGPA